MPQNTPERSYPYPCYGDASDFPAQMLAFASAVDADVEQLANDVTAGLNKDSIRLARETDLSVPNNTDTAVAWVDSPADPPWWAAGSTITIPKTAIYLISAQCQWATNDTGQRRCEIRRLTPSSITYALDAREAFGIATDLWTYQVVTTMTRATAGTTLELRVRQNSGAALNMFAAKISIAELSE